MSDIPTEIFPEILRCVPVESLFRFKSVCKTWRRIIDDPVFVKKHINRGIGQDWFFYRHEHGKLFLLPINELVNCGSNIKRFKATNLKNLSGPGIPRLREFQCPVACCNGFVLLSSSKYNLVWRIWNPFTGESLEIKQCDAFKNANFREDDDPICGFGYDEPNDNYKVVLIVNLLTFIYSVKLNKWRKIQDYPDTRVRIPRANGVFVYGAVHWIAHPWNDRENVGCVFAVGLNTEKYRKISLPSEVIQHKRMPALTVLSGCLFLHCSIEDTFCVWMIKDYGFEETWIQVVSVKEKQLSLITPVAYSISKEQVLLHFYLKKPEHYITNCSKEDYLWYDVRKQCSEKLGIEVELKVDDYGDYCDCEYRYGSFTSQVNIVSSC